MKVTDQTIDRICDLAKLKFEGNARSGIKKDLESILDLCEKLGEVDTSQAEPLIHLSTEVNRWREDEPKPPLDKQEVLKNAPRKDSDYFKVPRFRE